MSQDLIKARKLLASSGTSLKQEKVQSAAQSIHDAIILIFKNPLMKQEKEEFQNMIQQSLDSLAHNATFRKYYPLVIEYTPGKEKKLLATMKEIISELDSLMQAEAQAHIETISARKQEAIEKGQKHIDAQEFDKAREVYDQLVREYPDDTDLVADIADRFMQAARYKDAFVYLEEALSNDPNAMHLYNRIGIALRKMKDFDTAEKYYLKALELSGKDEYLWFNVGRLYVDWGKWDKVVDAAEKAMAINPGFDQAGKMLAFAKKKM